MSEETETMTEEKCTAKGGKIVDGKCVIPEKTADSEEKATFTNRLQKAFDEAIEVKLAAMEKKFDDMITAKLAALEIEAEQVLRKGLGVDKDTPLTTKDIPSLIKQVRKAALENSEKTRAPSATEKAGPEGNTPADPIDNLFKPYLEEKKA